MNDTLSAFPFYGGKAKMAYLIADLLDYDKTTDTYIELFGGGARTLLNKPRHEVEIYNDSSHALGALFYCLSKPDSAIELIKTLYETTDSSEECFLRCLDYRSMYEDDFLTETKKILKRYVKKLSEKYDIETTKDFRNALLNNRSIRDTASIFTVGFPLKNLSDSENRILRHEIERYSFCAQQYQKAYGEIMKNFGTQDEKTARWNIKVDIRRLKYDYKVMHDKKVKSDEIEPQSIVDEKTYFKDAKKEIKSIVKKMALIEAQESVMKTDTYSNNTDYEKSRLKLAAATFVTQALSRNGAAREYSGTKFDSDDAYYNYVDRLYDVAERLNGVSVYTLDAMIFFREPDDKEILEYVEEIHGGLDKLLESGNDTIRKFAKPLFSKWLDSTNIMMYLDPTYLQQKDMAKKKNGESKDVGKSGYYQSWNEEQHRRFLYAIRGAKCKILLSNYDDNNSVYKTILTEKTAHEDYGVKWKRIEFETTTSVYNDSDDKERIEVLWKNY